VYTITFNNLTREAVKVLHDSLMAQPMFAVEALVNEVRLQVKEQDEKATDNSKSTGE